MKIVIDAPDPGKPGPLTADATIPGATAHIEIDNLSSVANAITALELLASKLTALLPKPPAP